MEASETKVRVFARGVCQYPLERMEIIANGAVQHIMEGKGGQHELVCETSIAISESTWLAARVRGRVEPENYGGVAPWSLHAHTSPIYILKRNRPILQRADATAMADYIRFITERYRKAHFENKEHQRALFKHLNRGLKFYEGLLNPAHRHP